MAMVEDILQTRLDLVGLGAWTSGFGRAAEAVGLVDAAVTASQRKLLSYGIAAGTAALAIAAGLAKTVAAAGQIQQLEIAFTTLLGSAEAARAKIAELQEFDKLTPFNLEATMHGAQQLVAAGASADRVIPIMQALGNAMAASGRGSESFGRAMYAVSQILTAGKLMGSEVRQLTEAGVPVREWMAEMGVGAGQIAAGGVSAEKAMEALINVMNRGRFAGGMEAQSKTLNGSLEILRGSIFQLEAAIGKGLVGPVAAAVKLVGRLVDAVNAMPEGIKRLIGYIGVGLVGSLAIMAVKCAIGVVQLGRLATAHLSAAAAARTHAAAEAQAAAAVGIGSAASAVGAGAAAASTGGMAAGAAGAAAAASKKTGRLGKLRGGIGAMAAFVGGELALGMLPDEGGVGAGKRIGQGALAGAGMGMMIGSLVPGIGTGIGAGVGAVAGGILGGFSGPEAKAAEKAVEKPEGAILAELRKQNDLLKQQLGELQGIRAGKLPFDTGDLPGAYQAMALRMARAIG